MVCRVGDVEEGVHLIAWPFDWGVAAMGELSHRAGRRGLGAALRLRGAAARPPRCGQPPPGCYDPRMPAAYTSELAEALAADVLDRFLRYVRVDTQSARDRDGEPEHARPARPLADARRRAARDRPRGRRARRATATCFATLPATDGAPHAVGLIAHVDVSPDAPGAGVEPIVHRDYDGVAHRAAARRHGARPRRHARARRQGRPRRRDLQRRHAARAPTTRPAWPRSWPRSPTWPRIPSSPARR